MKEELSLREIINEVILFFINFKVLIISITLFGVLSVIVFQKIRPEFYTTRAIATSGISTFERIEGEKKMHQRTAINLINNLQLDINKEDYTIIAKKLNIDSVQASFIRSIKAEHIYRIDGDNKKYDTPKFSIQLFVKDNSIIPLVQSGLLNYFNDNQYINDYYNSFQQTNNQEISAIDKEIKALQSLRSNRESKIDMSSFNLYSKKGVTEVQNQIVELIQARSVNSTNQLLLKPLSFVQGFSISQVPERGVLLLGSIAAGISFLLAIIIAVFKNVYIRSKEQ